MVSTGVFPKMCEKTASFSLADQNRIRPETRIVRDGVLRTQAEALPSKLAIHDRVVNRNSGLFIGIEPRQRFFGNPPHDLITVVSQVGFQR